jgi:hypothetical protein
MVLLLVHAAVTLFMVGVIWFVQVVHYPLFARVGRPDYSAYSIRHTRLTGLVVGPPMLLEAATAIALVVWTPPGISGSLVWTGLLLVAGIWLSTALLQAPRHTALGRGFDPAAHRFLVTSNWLRTVLWSLRGLVVLCILYRVMGSYHS